MVVNLHQSGLSQTRLVHRLVAETFLGPCPQCKEVNHKDKSKTSNFASNLEYLTRSANLRYSESNRGIHNSQARLTEEQVRAIRALHATGMGYKRLAKTFNLSWSLVRNAASGRTWTYL